MELGEMGFKSPKIGGRGFGNPSVSSNPMSSKPMAKSKPLEVSSISSATTGGGAPPVKNLGAKIIGALRMRRKGMGAPKAGRRL